ncbi:MAG: hypothetical protein KC468_33575, partial [Myxococcales bacterium]|nr:hypothetical protein [Myxococcales bacterium]
VPLAHGGELLLLFVLEGAARLELDAPGDGEHALPAGACLALPAGAPARLRVVREPLELLEVTLPA